MENNKKVILIDGVFDTSDAKDILVTLLQNKIKYHNLKNFRSKEMKGEEDESCVKRVAELKKSIQEVLELFNEKKSTIKLYSEVSIKTEE